MGVFDDIYKSNGWGFGSGHGSLPTVTKGYRNFLEMFLRENNIKSVVDYGCGDWQFSRYVNWGRAKYTGIDLVESLIDANNKRYGSNSISFSTIKPGGTNLPKADLLLVKDVLQHMPNADVQKFIKDILPKYKYALLTNCILPPEDINIDIETGGFRPLDLRSKPFNVKGVVAFAFIGPKSFAWKERRLFPAWKKQVLLVIN